MPQVDLYYSRTFLGHFTLIISDTVDLIAQRVHFVDADAANAHGGKLAWAVHKIAQVTGYATGQVLSDVESSPRGFDDRMNYGTAARPRIRQWQVTVPQMDQMLN